MKITKNLAIILVVILILTSCGKKPKEEVSNNPETSLTKEDTEEVEEDEISKNFSPKVVRDIEAIKKMRSWLEYFYYNNVFDQDLNNETGEISEDAMISFAASYIMQLENKGLRFDTDTFHLYIPRDVLEEVVQRFFNHKIEKHHSISKHKILFEKDNYVIEATAREWLTRLDVLNIKEIKPKKYLAILNGFNVEIGEVEYQVHAEFVDFNERYILKNIKIFSDKSKFIEGNPLELGNPNNDNKGESSGAYQEQNAEGQDNKEVQENDNKNPETVDPSQNKQGEE